ncbi:hypothetical protein [uncultured Microbacterium sp.]|uniref:hypothetical protein n=1 Tax=uncultured Microbacterium sp. TaxID=191216 RepID=UPI0035CB43B6
MRFRVFAATALLLAIAALAACVPPGVACPAIGYVYMSPVKVEISADLVGNGTVAACFGAECEPAAIAPSRDGGWEVPPEPPYAAADTIGLYPGAGIRIVIVDGSGEVVRDEWIEIPYTSTSNGSCPGPVDFHSVAVS